MQNPMKYTSSGSILFAKVPILGFPEYKRLNLTNSYTEIIGNLDDTECPVHLFLQ